MENRSFTLIEILVVIVIIGILSAFIIVSMAGVSSKAAIAKSQAFANSLRNSLLLDLVSEWKLDGDTSDPWSGGNNGTWSGSGGTNTSANWRPVTECVSGQCLDFDGYDDRVYFGTDPELTISNNWTCEHWINWPGQSNVYVFYAGIGGTSPNFLIKYSGNNFAFRPTGGAEIYYMFVSSNEHIDKWTHLAWVADSSNNLSLYINGRLAITRNIVAPHTTSLTFRAIGNAYGGTSYTYQGKIDEVHLYNAAIPSSQIQENYYSGLNKLLANKGMGSREFQSRIGELKINLTKIF
ncbi:MAG: LamG domain-containing protein [Candidatus Paceibacterota bacterium]|jgi:prepilin-type N-terminal cleavage/methylation domain-containing protein